MGPTAVQSSRHHGFAPSIKLLLLSYSCVYSIIPLLFNQYVFQAPILLFIWYNWGEPQKMNEMGPPPSQELRAPWEQTTILANHYNVGQNWVSASKEFHPRGRECSEGRMSYLAG